MMLASVKGFQEDIIADPNGQEVVSILTPRAKLLLVALTTVLSPEARAAERSPKKIFLLAMEEFPNQMVPGLEKQ
jgi:hypothetical protein